ncbi:hypothetical protein MMPV_002014 [Pyropia vietnamensis]
MAPSAAPAATTNAAVAAAFVPPPPLTARLGYRRRIGGGDGGSGGRHRRPTRPARGTPGVAPAVITLTAAASPTEPPQGGCSCGGVERRGGAAGGDRRAAAGTVSAATSTTCEHAWTRRRVLRTAAVAACGAVGVAAAAGGAACVHSPAVLAAAATASTATGGEAGPPPLPATADYDAYAATYDALDGPSALSRAFGLDDARRSLVARAHGDVLELAIGTGLNLPLYGPPPGAGTTGVGDMDGGGGSDDGGTGAGHRLPVTSITGVDVSTGMLAIAARRAAATPIPVSLRAADATRMLPFPDASFDTVLDTYSLCTFGAPAGALAEAARLLRPGGVVLLLEHVRSRWPPVGVYQDLTAGAVAAASKGCMWNQDVRGAATAAGFRIVTDTRYAGGTVAALELRLP